MPATGSGDSDLAAKSVFYRVLVDDDRVTVAIVSVYSWSG